MRMDKLYGKLKLYNISTLYGKIEVNTKNSDWALISQNNVNGTRRSYLHTVRYIFKLSN